MLLERRHKNSKTLVTIWPVCKYGEFNIKIKRGRQNPTSANDFCYLAMLVIETICTTNAALEQEERFDKVMLNKYIIGHVNDAVNPDLEEIYTVMLSLRSSN